MLKGFVFGKFLPFHKGHEAMIRFARAHCDALTVLVCCSNKEAIPCATRCQWVEAATAGIPGIAVQAFSYDEEVLINSSVSSAHVSRQWAGVFAAVLPGHALLVTSEPYGNLVAGFMGIRHLAYDYERRHTPIAASAIHQNLRQHWQYLPNAVKPYYSRKVVLLGTESTGKSTLTEFLAGHYGATMVSEAGRDIIASSTSFSIDDLYTVAHVHAERIAAAVAGPAPLVFIDTDVHITQSYARFVFNASLTLPAHIYTQNEAGLYLYLTADAPYHQDGTRLDKDYRNQLDASHRAMLAQHSITYTEISGSWEQRQAAAVAAVAAWLQSLPAQQGRL